MATMDGENLIAEMNKMILSPVRIPPTEMRIAPQGSVPTLYVH